MEACAELCRSVGAWRRVLSCAGASVRLGVFGRTNLAKAYQPREAVPTSLSRANLAKSYQPR